MGVSIIIGLVLVVIYAAIPGCIHPIATFVAVFPFLWGVFNIVMLVSSTLRMIGEILSEDIEVSHDSSRQF